MRRWFRAFCGGIATLVQLAAISCERPTTWLRFERVEPAERSSSIPLLALNQPIHVYFSDALDPASVSRESVRVVDAQGTPVDGALEVGTRSVRFRPRTPVAADLLDGSFRPGAEYRLELAGMPASYALRSRAGRPLERSLVLRFATAREPAELGMFSLLLPVGIGDEALSVDLLAQPELRLPRRARTLVIPLTLPPLPASVTPASVTLWRIEPGAAAPRATAIATARSRLVEDRVPGSFTIAELELVVGDQEPIADDDVFFLQFHSGDAALLDYRGRPMTIPPAPLPIKVDPGERTRATDFDLSSLHFHTESDSGVGFEFAEGRLVPRLRVEAGTGRLGPLRLPKDMRMELREWLAGSAAAKAAAEASQPLGIQTIDLTTLELEPGAELTIEAGEEPVVLRVLGDVRLDGTIRLVGSHRPAPWRSGRSPGADELLRSAAVAIVCGGDFTLGPHGRIETATEADGSPMTILLGGTPVFLGTAPPQLIVGLPPGSRIVGALESPRILPTSLRRGVQDGARIRARAVSEWIAVGGESGCMIDFEITDLRGGLRLAAQVAPGDLSDPSRPRSDAESYSPPRALPLATPLPVPRGGFVRLLLEGEVTASDWPSLVGIAIEAR